MEKINLQGMKGGRVSMKFVGIAFAALLVSSILAVGAFAQAEAHGAPVEAKVIGKSPVTIRAIQGGGTVSSVEAAEVVPSPAGFADVETVIEEVENAIPEARRVGFVQATFAKGFMVDDDLNHLSLVEGIWAVVSVTTSSDAADARKIASGRIKVDNEVYKLVRTSVDAESLTDLTDDSVEFALVDPNSKEQGTLSLTRVGSYDDGARSVWTGSLEIGETEGEITLASIKRTVRKASDEEIREVPIGRFDGESSFDTGSGSDATLAQDRAVGAEASEGNGFFGWLRRTFS